jgi:hypothetical protein
MDIGGFVVGEKHSTAVLFGKSAGVLAGVPFFQVCTRVVGANLGAGLWVFFCWSPSQGAPLERVHWVSPEVECLWGLAYVRSGRV